MDDMAQPRSLAAQYIENSRGFLIAFKEDQEATLGQDGDWLFARCAEIAAEFDASINLFETALEDGRSNDELINLCRLAQKRYYQARDKLKALGVSEVSVPFAVLDDAVQQAEGF